AYTGPDGGLALSQQGSISATVSGGNWVLVSPSIVAALSVDTPHIVASQLDTMMTFTIGLGSNTETQNARGTASGTLADHDSQASAHWVADRIAHLDGVTLLALAGKVDEFSIFMTV